MMLPPAVLREVEAELGPIHGLRPVGGGSISASARVEAEAGPVFLKYAVDAPARMFAVESAGLDRLREASIGVRVPLVLAVCDAGSRGVGWIALEWLEPGRRGKGYWDRLALGLLSLHRMPGGGWGAEEDGFIGPLPQRNTPAGTWAEFWWTERLEPQLQLANERGGHPGAGADWELLAERLPRILAAAEQDGPSLLHGDLWSGNVLAGEGGAPALVDPAPYEGHREVDLAMTELFGGFDAAFYAAYERGWPLQPGYRELRRDVYQLYYLLVHVNLFGEGYHAQTAACLRRALAAS
ncbi:MAG: fructosamine kinase family protein [Gemmatimonadetes bacterium]|nr:fructosamine kinase family protein [Gemmatimonadota bacterium]